MENPEMQEGPREEQAQQPPAAAPPQTGPGSSGPAPVPALSPAQAKATLQELQTLAASVGEHSEQMDRLTKVLRDNDYRAEVTQVIQEALALPNPNPHVGALWMRRIVTSKVWDRSYPESMDALCDRGELGRRAVLEFLETAGKKRRPKLVLKALRRHGGWLREQPRGWSIMARALTNAGCYRQCVRWTNSWRKVIRADFQALYARGVALHAQGKSRAALPVIEAALEMSGSELEKSELRLWRAMQNALDKATGNADADFRNLNPTGWGDDTLCLFYLVRGMIRVQQAPKPDRAEAFEAAYHRILDRFRGTRVYLRSRSLRRDYRCCMWRMSVDAGRYGQALLAWWRTADSWLPLLVLLLVPGLQLLLPLYLYRYLRNRDRKRRKSPFETLL
jgi:hypothetical protein